MSLDLNQIAMQIVQDFRNGDAFWGDHSFEVTFPKGYLAAKFREWVENQCYDGSSLQEVLELSSVSWSLKRVEEIEAGGIDPSFSELDQWCDANPDYCEPVGLITQPLEKEGKILGWALIEHSGFALSPDIELLGTFTEMDKLRQFVAENFEG